MGLIEEKVKKRVRKENIRHAILSPLPAGVLMVALAAPNVLKLLKYGSVLTAIHVKDPSIA